MEGLLIQYWPYLAVAGVSFMLALLLFLSFIRPLDIKRQQKILQERRDQFVDLASHYLLNPISVIQAAISRLQEDDQTLGVEKRYALYDAIQRGQQRLWILTEQLILVGQIDQNEMKLELSVGNLSEVVSDAITAVQPFIKEKGIKLHLQDSLQNIQEVRMDLRRMKQAVIAVLDNAIKFSREGSEVWVSISLQSGIFVVLIQDQGIGMPDKIIQHLSEKFYRGTQIYNFDYEGIGLGLHIAQAILEQHQGIISFASKEGQGTAVTIQFPSS